MRILVVDRGPDAGMEFMNTLQVSGVAEVTFLDRAPQAIKNVKRRVYDLILLGDGIEDGDTYDVGLALKDSKRNRRVPVVCIGAHAGRAVRLYNLLQPYALQSNKGGIEKLRAYLEREAYCA